MKEREAAGVKLVANSGYGVFGRPKFHFYDPRLTEIITAFGRRIILSLKEECPKLQLRALYGDTDSIFLQGDDRNIEKFTEWAETKFDVTLDGKKWDVVVLTRNKKSYFGILKGTAVRKKLWGLRRNNTLFEKELVSKITDKEIIELVSSDKEEAKRTAFHTLKSAFARLHECSPEMKSKLGFSFVASKSLNEYGEGYQREIYLETGKSEVGQKYVYYKIKPIELDGRIKKFSTRPDNLDIEKYKESCWNCIEPIIEAYGFDVQELRRCLMNGEEINIHISTDQPI
jgi:DNA polymerase, archaea type